MTFRKFLKRLIRENMYIFLTHVIFYNIIFKGKCYPQNCRIQYSKLRICRKSSKAKAGVKLFFKNTKKVSLSYKYQDVPNMNLVQSYEVTAYYTTITYWNYHITIIKKLLLFLPLFSYYCSDNGMQCNGCTKQILFNGCSKLAKNVLFLCENKLY